MPKTNGNQKEPVPLVKELSLHQIDSNARMNILRKTISNALKEAHDECVEEGKGEMTFYEVNTVLIHNLHVYNKAGLSNEVKHRES